MPTLHLKRARRKNNFVSSAHRRFTATEKFAIMAGSKAQGGSSESQSSRETRILETRLPQAGEFIFSDSQTGFLGDWNIELNRATTDAKNLLEAARMLQQTDTPVAFPTETVYGLGADATRSSAVRGIYKAKQRPADNPLIVHISSLTQLRSILVPQQQSDSASFPGTQADMSAHDPIPAIYSPLIQRFWPGPLTILLPNPPNSTLAPEVTAGLPTFGARMPSSRLALALIKLAGVPLAAPSANASTKPSPTTAQHVKHDLDGRIEIILDGGPCEVGVESTVVDGLSDPPLILRPGGVSIEQLRECKGWENVAVGYKDGSEKGRTPRAPGMKYKHYSPKAKVVLVETGVGDGQLDSFLVDTYLDEGIRSIGVIRTKYWKPFDNGCRHLKDATNGTANGTICASRSHDSKFHLAGGSNHSSSTSSSAASSVTKLTTNLPVTVWDLHLGSSTADIARGLFSALRELDQKGVDLIFVEGIDDAEGDAAAAVMNRLRKAAEVEVKS